MRVGLRRGGIPHLTSPRKAGERAKRANRPLNSRGTLSRSARTDSTSFRYSANRSLRRRKVGKMRRDRTMLILPPRQWFSPMAVRMNRTDRGAGHGRRYQAGAGHRQHHGRGGRGRGDGGSPARPRAAVATPPTRTSRRVGRHRRREAARQRSADVEEITDMARAASATTDSHANSHQRHRALQFSSHAIAWLHDNGASDGVITEINTAYHRPPLRTCGRFTSRSTSWPPPPRPRIYGPTFGGFGLYR